MGKVGPGILREINRRMILKLIRQNQPISRKHLVSLSNLGKNTVSLIAEELIMDDIIYEAYTENKKQVGRPTVALKFKEAALPVLGIVLSHNKISGAVFDYSLTQLDKQTIDINEQEEYIESLTSFIKKYTSKYELFGISIAVPGIVDTRNGVVIKSHRLRWYDFNLKEIIEDIVDTRVYICNTVKSIALLQYELGTTKSETAFFMNIDKGLGGAYIDKSNVLYGKGGAAGEIGQLKMSMINDNEDKTIESYYCELLKDEDLACLSESKMEKICEVLEGIIEYINLLFDPEKIFLYGNVIQNISKKSQNIHFSSNVEICQKLDRNVAAAYSLINKYENDITY